jgi:hypothetical protein
MTVIATSSAVAAGTGVRALINFRLAMLLQWRPPPVASPAA